MFANGFPNFDTRDVLKKKKRQQRGIKGKIPWEEISLSIETLFKEEEE